VNIIATKSMSIVHGSRLRSGTPGSFPLMAARSYALTHFASYHEDANGDKEESIRAGPLVDAEGI